MLPSPELDEGHTENHTRMATTDTINIEPAEAE